MSSLTLFSELAFGGDLKLKNRLVLAPLTRGRSGISQIPNEVNAEYYTQRCNAGLVITEGTIVSKTGMGWAGAAAIYSSEHVEGWKFVTKKVHEANGVIFCQLWHMGRVASSCFHGIQPISASAIAAPGQVTDYSLNKIPYEVPRALETAEIIDVVNEYRIAAKNAKEAGFDGIELHSANGYFLDQFLQSCSNHRIDRYGGSPENRFRILGEVIAACSEVFPSSRIGVRLSPNGNFNGMGCADNFDSFKYFISELNKYQLAYVHVMDGLGFGFHNLCAQMKLSDIRKVYDGVIMGNCGYGKLTAEGALNTGAADLIAFGRPYISNPDLAARFANNWPLVDATSSHSTWWHYPGFPSLEGRQHAVGYSDFPVYAEE